MNLASRTIAAGRDPLDGLTRDEVGKRIARGAVNNLPEGPSRTTADIVRANVVTRFNILLGTLLVVIVLVAPIQDALFGIVLFVNTAIGILQELRAKRTLDRLALLSAPRARVVRGGEIAEIAINQVVVDDVLELHPGDQIIVDGVVLAARGLEVDESLLSGESDPIQKGSGEQVLSGSFVAAGSGRFRATRVGRAAYAISLAEEARKFTLVHSDLKKAIDWILAGVSWALVPTVALLVWSQLDANASVKEALRASVAGTVAMVPQGLVLLTSVAFAVAVIRLGRRSVLVQELPAVEGLARVDVVCFDKTGTLTEGKLQVHAVEVFTEGYDPAPALEALAAVDPAPNATLRAVAKAYPTEHPPSPSALVPFSSARKWSAASFPESGTWVVGAPEVVAPGDQAVEARIVTHAEQGRRVLLLAHSDIPLQGEQLPPGLRPVAALALGDAIRDDAVDTVAYFTAQGVKVKVISGDHPRTVGAIAAEAGIPDADRMIDARRLPQTKVELVEAIEQGTVFGRVTPHQKRAMVAALQARGHVVAMTGDGVNDVLALKDADIGIAMGSGSSASRSVAQLVLLDGKFATLPGVVAEGRRVIANIERVANLFVTKTIYALLLALAVGVAGRPFPFLPRHLTLVGSITIGVPAFFLALEPNARRALPGFIRRVLRFSLPTGTLAAIATFAAYEVARAEDVSLVESRTIATIVLACIGLFALVIVSRPFNVMRRILIGVMGLVIFFSVASPTWRTFFELNLPRTVVVLA
ncbi:MAG: HAD-IC family P-type ATPase, partial [Acidimicrobiia bacterium]